MKKFLLIDDHEIVRMGIKSLLVSLFSTCKIYEAINGESAITSLKERSYDLVIADIQMPNMDIFGLIEYININFPGTKVLIFSMSAENIYAKKILHAGAMGFVSKGAGVPEFEKAIILVLNNEQYISTVFANQLANDVSAQTINPFHKLSPKEFEICIHLMENRSVTEISQILSISTSTVGTHKARVLQKLKVKNLVELSDLGRQYSIVR